METKRSNLYRKFTLLFLLLLFNKLLTAQNANLETPLINYPSELVQIAESIDMVAINGDNFDRTDYYGGHGLPFIFGVLTKPSPSTRITPRSVLFWCRKDEKEYLVYALYSFSTNKYEVNEIISKAKLVGHDYDLSDTFGMVVYDGVLGIEKDLSHFIYLEDRNKNGPEGIFPTPENGFWPVIMYNESFVQVLYNYDGKWLTYVESDV